MEIYECFDFNWNYWELYIDCSRCVPIGMLQRNQNKYPLWARKKYPKNALATAALDFIAA